MIFYKHYIGDFQRDTGHLSLTARGAYLCLMHHYYSTEKPLPNDHAALCRIAGATTKLERESVMQVMSFFEAVDSGLMHNRIEAEIHKAGKQADTNRQIAVEREAKRKAERNTPQTDHEKSTNRATSRDTNREPSQTSESIQIPSVAKATGDPAGPPPMAGQGLLAIDPCPPDPPPEPPDLRDQVFALGVAMLTGSGVKETSARSFLAMSSKAHGDAAVVAALEACAINKPIQPIPWLQQRLKPVAGRVGKHTGFDQKDYSAGVTNDGQLA